MKRPPLAMRHTSDEVVFAVALWFALMITAGCALLLVVELTRVPA